MKQGFESASHQEGLRHELKQLENELRELESPQSKRATEQVVEAGYGEHNEVYANRLALVRLRIDAIKKELGIVPQKTETTPRSQEQGYDRDQYSELDSWR